MMDGVQVALGHELLLDVDFRVVGAEEEAVRQDLSLIHI